MTDTLDLIRNVKPWRGFALGFAGAAAVIAGAPLLRAEGLAGHDSNAPVNYAADRIELQDKAKRVILSGNVQITQGDLHVNSARSTLSYTDQPDLKLHRLDAVGGVDVTRGNERARGDVAVYDFDRRLITMLGHVALRRSTDTLNGGRLVIDLNTGLSSVDGRSNGGSSALGAAGGTNSGGGATNGGRVSGTFAVPKKN
jgi:lipopolysaccharide export system protein LptA